MSKDRRIGVITALTRKIGVCNIRIKANNFGLWQTVFTVFNKSDLAP